MSPHTCFLCVRSVQATRKKVTRTPGDSRLPHSKRACGSRRTEASTGPTRTDRTRKNYKNNSCQRFLHKRLQPKNFQIR